MTTGTTYTELAAQIPGAVLLSGIVGSTAYGMAGEESDTDRLAVYAAPTVAFHGLDLPIEKAATVVFPKPGPDFQVHEARKFVLLAMKSNPTATELLWLDGSFYEHRSPLGDALIYLRPYLASVELVCKAYFGFAEQQLKKLAATGQYTSKNRSDAVKHGRHVMRLLDQGFEFYSTGQLTVRATPQRRDMYFEIGEQLAANPPLGAKILAEYEARFAAARSPLPVVPDRQRAGQWLRDVRRFYWENPV